MKIVFTGTESTFKSSLASALAEDFGVPYVPEYARTFLEDIAPETPIDPMPRAAYDTIEEGQLNLQCKHGYFSEGTSAIFDTDGTVLHLWKADKFDEVDDRLLAIPEDVIFCLCYPNVQAGADPLRVDEVRREELHERYKRLLSTLPNKVWHLDKPNFQDRYLQAKQYMQQYLDDTI